MKDLNIIAADRTDLPVFSISPTALQRRDIALSEALLIEKVDNAKDNEKAVLALQGLKGIAASFEKARKTVKEPLIEAGRRLDRAVATAIINVEKEQGRIQNLLSQFALEEQRRVAEERIAQQRELERIERQRQEELAEIRRKQEEAERIAREAEEEANRQQAAAKNAKQRKAAEEARQAAEVAALVAKAAESKAAEETLRVEEQSLMATLVEGKPVLATRADGQVTKTDWEITVVNPYELAKFHPDCVKIEPLLMPIKQALNAGITVRGVKAEKVVKTTARVTGRTNLIEI